MAHQFLFIIMNTGKTQYYSPDNKSKAETRQISEERKWVIRSGDEQWI